MRFMLEWRLVGRGLENQQILARDPQGGVLAINRVITTGKPDTWWLTGASYGLGSCHASQDAAKAAAQHWVDTGMRAETGQPEVDHRAGRITPTDDRAHEWHPPAEHLGQRRQ